MHRERVCAVNSWRKGPGHCDTIFINTNPFAEGMRGLDIAHVRLFFSFSHDGVQYPCALVHWFSRMGDSPNDNTGMWVVEPDISDDDGETLTSIVHLNTIVQAAHLLPVFGHEFVPRTLSFSDTLNELLASMSTNMLITTRLRSLSDPPLSIWKAYPLSTSRQS